MIGLMKAHIVGALTLVAMATPAAADDVGPNYGSPFGVMSGFVINCPSSNGTFKAISCTAKSVTSGVSVPLPVNGYGDPIGGLSTLPSTLLGSVATAASAPTATGDIQPQTDSQPGCLAACGRDIFARKHERHVQPVVAKPSVTKHLRARRGNAGVIAG